jgi:hypothetical protein
MSEPSSPADLAPPPLSPAEALLHLWRRRWIILGAAVVSAGIAYGVSFARLPQARTFEARAMVLVRMHPLVLNMKDDELRNAIETPAYEALFLGDEIIDEVRQRARAAKVKAADASLEALKGMLNATYKVTRDTTVFTTFSPVITLSAKTADAESSKALLDLWLAVLVERFGTLASDEARLIAAAAEEASAALEAESARVGAEQARAEARMRVATTMIDGRLRMLTSAAPVAPRAVVEGPNILGGGLRPVQGGARVSVQGEAPNSYLGPGLWDRRVELARAVTEEGMSPEEIAGEQARIDAMEATVAKDLDALVAQQAEAGAALARIQQARRELDQHIEVNAAVMAYAKTQLALARREGINATELRVISRPVLPESGRGATVSKLLALAAGLAVAAALVVYFVVERAVQRVADWERRTRG